MKKSYWLLLLALTVLAPCLALGDLSNKQLENLIMRQTSLKLDKAAVVKALGNPSTDTNVLSEKALRKVVGRFLNMSSLPPTSIDSQVVLFKGSTGKMLKASQGTGIAKLTAGVLSFGVAAVDYVVPSGNVATATALAANGTNCSAGQAALGVNAAGNSVGCWIPSGTYSLPQATTTILGGVKPNGTTITAVAGVIGVVNPLNQNTTGSAAKLTTPRTINGVAFDGSVNIQTATASTSDYTATTWPPSPTGLTTTGAPTYSGKYTRVGNRIFFDLTISANGGTTASAGSAGSYFAGLPTTTAGADVCIVSDSNGAAIGTGLVSGTRVYTPSWTARNTTSGVVG